MQTRWIKGLLLLVWLVGCSSTPPKTEQVLPRSSIIAKLSLPTAYTTLVSVGQDASGNPVPGNASSTSDVSGPGLGPSVSSDGRYVAFASNASNLVPGDTNGVMDVFVRDVVSGTTTLVSRATGVSGAQANNRSLNPSISEDGRYVVFESSASNLGVSTTSNIFLRDLQNNTTTVVTGTPIAYGISFSPVISADGKYIAYTSGGKQTTNDANSFNDIYLYSVQTATTTLASTTASGSGTANNGSSNPAISADGRFVAFQSSATNLLPTDTNPSAIDDIFVWDRQTGTTRLVSLGSGGVGANNASRKPTISGDGRYIAFESIATNLLPQDTDNFSDIYLYDMQTSTLSLVSVGSSGKGNNSSINAALSSDGRFVGFDSSATNLSANDTSGDQDVYRYDRVTGTTQLISQSTAGVNGSGQSNYPALSTTGAFTVFESAVSNLVVGDTNNVKDVFLRFEPLPDITPPNIMPNVSGLAGTNGWYKGDVSVSWTVEDLESNISSSSGCDAVSITADTSVDGTTLTCTSTSAGGSSSKSVTIKLDKTPPTLSPSVSPNPVLQNASATAAANASDAPSGLASQSCATPDTTAVGNQSVTCAATDIAGNTNTASAAYSVVAPDATPPNIKANLSGTLGNNGWYISNVDLTWDVSDLESAITNQKGCDPVSVATDSSEVSNTCSATSSGGSASNTQIIQIDKTPPAVSATQAPSANANGWNNSSVTVTFSGNDATSKIENCSTSITLSANGANQSASGSCTDKAGNSASATANSIKIDTISPVVTVQGVANGATYTQGSVPSASCITQDGLSGVATSATLSITGGSGGLGTFTATCSGALDKAGNSGNASLTYTVVARSFVFTGFFQPVDNIPTYNSMKAGAAVPIKFSLGGNFGLDILASGYPTSRQITCNTSAPTDEIEQTVTGNGGGLSYDSATNQYQFVWKTTSTWKGTCRELILKLSDGSTNSAYFVFK